jgi:hypothetical protein
MEWNNKQMILRIAHGNFDGDVFAMFVAISDLGSDDLVEQEQDILVSHFLYVRTDSEVPYGWWTRGGQVHAAGSIVTPYSYGCQGGRR